MTNVEKRLKDIPQQELINIDSIVEKINAKFDVNLADVLENADARKQYLYLYILADEILREYNQVRLSFGFLYEYPLYPYHDMAIMAKLLGIEFTEFHCNKYTDLVSYFDYFNFPGIQNPKKIYFRNDTPHLTRRASIAASLSDYILLYIQKQFHPVNLYETFLPTNKNYRLSQILATFILIPVDTFLEELKSFFDMLKPWDCENTLYETTLCDGFFSRFHVPATITSYYFRELKFVLEVLYNYNGTVELEICNKIHTTYKDLFR